MAQVGILDCQFGGGRCVVEDIERYRSCGYDVINAGALDHPRKKYDVLAATWTQLSEKRLRNVGCRAVVVKDKSPWPTHAFFERKAYAWLSAAARGSLAEPVSFLNM